MRIWQKEAYYRRIETIETFAHPGFVRAQKLCASAKTILDVGCGDGSKLARLGSKDTKRFGCEISSAAITLGRQKFPKIKFSSQTGEVLPYQSDNFERVVSFFVLEHTQNPEKLLKEMARVLESGGLLILVAPNFGAPNRSSPNFHGSRAKKLLTGFFADFFSGGKLNWLKVTANVKTMAGFESDLDTTIEPYLGSLLKFLKSLNLEILEESSYWGQEQGGAKIIQRIFRVLGEVNLYPLKFWGPHLFVVAKKL